MKYRAGILILIWSILLAEPISANLTIKSVYSSCKEEKTEAMSCSSKSKCKKPNDKKEKNDCNNTNRCNPLMSCPSGNFYLSNPVNISFVNFLVPEIKKTPVNDNRISEYLSEWWHPPEII